MMYTSLCYFRGLHCVFHLLWAGRIAVMFDLYGCCFYVVMLLSVWFDVFVVVAVFIIVLVILCVCVVCVSVFGFFSVVCVYIYIYLYIYIDMYVYSVIVLWCVCHLLALLVCRLRLFVSFTVCFFVMLYRRCSVVCASICSCLFLHVLLYDVLLFMCCVGSRC